MLGLSVSRVHMRYAQNAREVSMKGNQVTEGVLALGKDGTFGPLKGVRRPLTSLARLALTTSGAACC